MLVSLLKRIGLTLSLNDPQWGRGSQNNNQDGKKPNDGPPDLDQLWRDFNQRISQLLGGKFRFACAAVMLLASGMWLQTNQRALESYWQQAKTTALSTVDTLKNTTLDSKGLESATQAISTATEQAKTAIVKSELKNWKSVWGGLVSEKNILLVALAGLLMLASVFFYGWKISFVVVPIAALMCVAPRFF